MIIEIFQLGNSLSGDIEFRIIKLGQATQTFNTISAIQPWATFSRRARDP